MRTTKYILAVSLAVILLAPSALAQNTTDIQAKIAALMQQIKQLQAQIAALQASTPKQWCHTFNTNLSMSGAGSEADALAEALKRDGSLSVTAFQERYRDEILTPNGLKNGTGYVGPSTRKKLNRLYGCKTNIKLPSPLPTLVPTTTSISTPVPILTPFSMPTSILFSTPSQSTEALPKKLTLTSPVGVHTWQRSTTYNVTWMGGQGDANTKINILLQQENSGTIPLVFDTKNDGIEPVYIPANIPYGKYSLRIYCKECNGPSPLDATQNSIDINNTFAGDNTITEIQVGAGEEVCKVLSKSGDVNDKLNIIFVPTHYYQDLGKFKNDATAIMEDFLLNPFYNDHKGQMNFFYVAKTSTIDGCNISNYSPYCSKIIMENLANNCGGYNKLKNDQIIAVFDSTRILLSLVSAQPGLIFIDSNRFGIFAHEFGHSFGGLVDAFDGNFENSSDSPYPNCASNSPGYTCQDKWGDLIGTGEGDQKVGCFQGCAAKNWYRPTAGGDIMRNANLNFFDPVSLRHMESLFKQYK